MTDERHSALAMHSVAADDAGSLVKRKQMMRRAKVLVVIVLLLLALGAAHTLFDRASSARALERSTRDHAQSYVKLVNPRSEDEKRTLSLPGTLQGFIQAPISARASGYLRRWYKDIGSRVEKGELLAEIEAPEIDQQLSQAKAARQQAASSLALASSTVKRWESLRARDAVSQQELDERRSADAQAQANVAAADANVERLRQLEAFKRVVAPFSGVITRRNVDVGDLIEAGSGPSGRPLFQLAQTDPLRVYINVPQAYAQMIRPGQQAVITQAEIRDRTFSGKVTRTSDAIDAATRTMQIEVMLANRDNALMPGALVQVTLPLTTSQSLVVPANTLLFRSEGVRVAIVDASGRVHLQPVRLGRNLGESMEVLDGVSAADRLVLNPSDSLAEGDEVSIVATGKAAP